MHGRRQSVPSLPEYGTGRAAVGDLGCRPAAVSARMGWDRRQGGTVINIPAAAVDFPSSICVRSIVVL